MDFLDSDNFEKIDKANNIYIEIGIKLFVNIEGVDFPLSSVFVGMRENEGNRLFAKLLLHIPAKLTGELREQPAIHEHQSFVRCETYASRAVHFLVLEHHHRFGHVDVRQIGVLERLGFSGCRASVAGERGGKGNGEQERREDKQIYYLTEFHFTASLHHGLSIDT